MRHIVPNPMLLSVALLSLTPLTAGASRGDPLSIEPLPEISDSFDGRSLPCPGLVGLKPYDGVHRYRMTYETVDAEGKPTPATGLVMVPVDRHPLPLLSYQHGTVLRREDAPSRLGVEAEAVGDCYATAGYVVASADYLGLGGSPQKFQAYHHADTEASAARDLLVAVRASAARLGAKLNGQLFLAGYSQGGHATMALHRELEREGVTVTASAPMSGAYDLLDTFFELLSRSVKTSVAEVALAVESMNTIYKVFPSQKALFVAPYDQKVPGLLDGSHDWPDVLKELPGTPAGLLQPSFLAKVKHDPNLPFVQDVRRNDVYDWKPLAPTRIYYAELDHEVPIFNAFKAYDRMKQLGANVQIVKLPGVDHVAGWTPATEDAVRWFATFRR